MNFFPIFLKFSTTRRVGTKRNYNFYFLSFSAFCILFWLEMKPQPYFLIFLIFWLCYLNFLLRVGQERNGTITFIFLLSIIFQPILAWNESLTIFFNFYYFFGIFYYSPGRNEMEREFLFSSFLGLFQPTLAWNKAIMVVFIFLNFFPFFWNFL